MKIQKDEDQTVNSQQSTDLVARVMLRKRVLISTISFAPVARLEAAQDPLSQMLHTSISYYRMTWKTAFLNGPLKSGGQLKSYLTSSGPGPSSAKLYLSQWDLVSEGFLAFDIQLFKMPIMPCCLDLAKAILEEYRFLGDKLVTDGCQRTGFVLQCHKQRLD
ncbi:hypothetical protein Tco_0097051 [Tanacetum coccineum]